MLEATLEATCLRLHQRLSWKAHARNHERHTIRSHHRLLFADAALSHLKGHSCTIQRPHQTPHPNPQLQVTFQATLQTASRPTAKGHLWGHISVHIRTHGCKPLQRSDQQLNHYPPSPYTLEVTMIPTCFIVTADCTRAATASMRALIRRQLSD